MATHLTTPPTAGAAPANGLFALGLAQFLTSFAFMASTPLLPLYVVDLGATTPTEALRWTGLALAIPPLLGAVATPVWGIVADRFGYKLAVERALLGIGLSIGLLGVIQSLPQLLLLRALGGLVGGFGAAAQAAALADGGAGQSRPIVVRLQSSQVGGAVLGPALGGLLASSLGIRPTLLICGILFIPSLVAVHRLYREPARLAKPSATASPVEGPASRRRARGLPLVFLLGTVFMFYLAEQALLPVLPGYLANLGAPADHLALVMGITLSVGSLAMAVSVRALPRLAPRGGGEALLPLLLGAAGVLAALLAPLTVWWAVLPMRGLAGLVLGLMLGLAYALAAEGTPRSELGRTMSLLSSAAFLGAAAGPLFGATLVGWHPEAPFLGIGLLYGLVALSLAVGTPPGRRIGRWVTRQG